MTQPRNRVDTIVLGAGIIGVSVALHLQERGQKVLLIDRRDPGSETSHGNAGLIERASVVPYAFPRDVASLLRHASNRSVAVRYRISTLLRQAPWLARYWWHSHPARLDEIARGILPLVERCIDEHARWTNAAGTQAFIRQSGWIELYRSLHDLQDAERAASALHEHRLVKDVLDVDALALREPRILAGSVAGGIHWRDPVTVSDPGAVTKAYASLFVERGGTFRQTDAERLQPSIEGWSIEVAEQSWRASEAVIALGPWSNGLCDRLGYRLPLAVKRGYHMHYSMAAGPPLAHPLCDSKAGFVLTPMDRGLRLTTGVELAERDAPPDYWQLDQAERIARRILPLGKRIDTEPWRGARPCLPDMLPIIGPAPRHRGLWFAFGHAHHGFTLGPATGRLLSEMMIGAEPFADPRPFSVLRFMGTVERGAWA